MRPILARGRAGSCGLALALAVCLSACGQSGQVAGASSPGGLPQVSIGIQISPAMAVPMVAKDLGFFAREGVDVQLKQFSAGKFALQAMLGGSVDLAVSGDVPVALAVMQGNDIRVLTQVVRSTSNEVRVVARRDGASTNPVQYFTAHRRKLATSLGGGPEFFTWTYLRHLGVPAADVQIVGQKPEDMPAALISGSVDAIAIFDPFAFIAEQQMGKKAITFPGTGLYSELYVLAATPATAKSRSTQIAAIVRALDGAAIQMRRNPAQAQRIVMKYTHLQAPVVAGIWHTFDFSPALTGQLLADWRDELAWARQTGKLDPHAPDPDFRRILDDRALRAVAPQAITD